jgi:hypothetical protein
LESDTKKRGRPTVTTNQHRILFFDKQGRALTNMFYVVIAQGILCNNWGEEKFKSLFVKSTGEFKNQSVLEQIGRMFYQNEFSESDCLTIAESAITMLQNKWKVKTVADWIRHGRNTNEW